MWGSESVLVRTLDCERRVSTNRRYHTFRKIGPSLHQYGGGGVILCLYVDDILIFGSSLKVIEEVKEFLAKNFEMKDLGEADVILNIMLLREGNGGVTVESLVRLEGGE